MANHLIEFNRRFEANRFRRKGKQGRATAKQVMDPRTRVIIFKMLNRELISEVNSCISIGKEANNYQATAGHFYENCKDVTFPVNLDFVTGTVVIRVEKLSRMFNAGLPVPEPKVLKSHVLLMDFIGEDGWAALKLKHAEITDSEACQLYRDCAVIMWKMYNICILVHADVSEFDILYHEKNAFIIDVSQSVEHEHPQVLEFLHKDCTNISNFLS